MVNYCDTRIEQIDIDSDDSEYEFNLELVQPPSLILTANIDGFESLSSIDDIDLLTVENINFIEFLNSVI